MRPRLFGFFGDDRLDDKNQIKVDLTVVEELEPKLAPDTDSQMVTGFLDRKGK